MKVLVLHAHPVDSSYGAALHRQTVIGLEKAGHEIDDCDLYAEGFNPVLSSQDRMHYYEVPGNRRAVEKYVRRLEEASALVIVSPVWTLGFPAILKGYFDRVWIPGVSFGIANGRVVPSLTNLSKLAAVMTYGAPRLRTRLLGDPPRRIVMQLLSGQIKPRPRVQYFAHYDMDRSTEYTRQRFLEKIKISFSNF